MLNKISLIIIFLIFFTCDSSPKEGWNKYLHSEDIIMAQETISTDLLSDYITTLSSDEFEGRKPATAGGKKTIKYLIDTFKGMKLKPGNPDGTWTQEVKMLGIRSNLRSQFITDEERWVMDTGEDIIGNTYLKKSKVNLQKVDLVFCGYGVTAPEYEWDDYKDIDVKNKVVVVLVNDPPVKKGDKLDPDMFKGNAMTYYGRWSYKYEEAMRRGAAGAIVIHEDIPAGYPFSVLQSGHDTERLTIEKNKSLKFEGWIPVKTAERLFTMGGLNFNQVKAKANNPNFKPFKMNVQFTSRISNKYRTVKSKNVVALHEGSDPELKNEYIIYTAHWDHLGINKKLSGDKIYNGAIDNASGTGMIMAAAKAFTALNEGTRRSILFLALTAEEEGLLGANYYNTNPLYPLNQTLAVINIDGMGNTFGRTKDLIIVGKDNSNLDQIVEMAAKQDKKYILPNPEPEKGYFYRSDHFEFAKMGVPSLYVNSGVDIRGKSKKYGLEKRNEYIKQHYHALSDEIKDDWTFDGLVEDNKILLRVGYAISQHSDWPAWNEGAEFKSQRDRMMLGEE